MGALRSGGHAVSATLVLNEGAVATTSRLFSRSRPNGRLLSKLLGEAFQQPESFIVGDGWVVGVTGLLLRWRARRSALGFADRRHEGLRCRRLSDVYDIQVLGVVDDGGPIHHGEIEGFPGGNGRRAEVVPALGVEHRFDGEFALDLSQNFFAVLGVRDHEQVDRAEDLAGELIDLEHEDELDVTVGGQARISFLIDLL